jgi:hypothetical protein
VLARRLLFSSTSPNKLPSCLVLGPDPRINHRYPVGTRLRGGKTLFIPKTGNGWIPVISTGRGRLVRPLHSHQHPVCMTKGGVPGAHNSKTSGQPPPPTPCSSPTIENASELHKTLLIAVASHCYLEIFHVFFTEFILTDQGQFFKHRRIGE